MAVQWTEEESRALYRIIPVDLFRKVVATIRDAIVGCPLFKTRVEEIASEIVAGEAVDQLRKELDGLHGQIAALREEMTAKAAEPVATPPETAADDAVDLTVDLTVVDDTPSAEDGIDLTLPA